VPSCHLLQVFRTCTAKWRGIWRKLKEEECPLISYVTSRGQTSSSTSPPHFFSHWSHGTGSAFPHVTLLLWSNPLTVKPSLHQFPLAFLREPVAREQWKSSLFLPTNRKKGDATEWTEKHSDQLHVLSKPHLLRLVFHREYLYKKWDRETEGINIISVKELTRESIRLWRDGAGSSNVPEGHGSARELGGIWVSNVQGMGKCGGQWEVCPAGLLTTCPSAWSSIKESCRHVEDEGHEICSRVEQRLLCPANTVLESTYIFWGNKKKHRHKIPSKTPAFSLKRKRSSENIRIWVVC